MTLKHFDKHTRYARFWDPTMPYDVSLNGIDEAIGRALSNGANAQIIERSNHLSQLANENLEYGVKLIKELVTTRASEDKAQPQGISDIQKSADGY